MKYVIEKWAAGYVVLTMNGKQIRAKIGPFDTEGEAVDEARKLAGRKKIIMYPSY